jgi:hypothetical protein
MKTVNAEIIGGPLDGELITIPENDSWNGRIIRVDGNAYLVSRRANVRTALIHTVFPTCG